MWSNYRTEFTAILCAVLLLSACAGAPPVPDAPTGSQSRPQARHDARAPASGASTTQAQSPDAAGPVPAVVEVPPRAALEFARAVELVRSGQLAEAELEFHELTVGYPQLAGPHTNLGILRRKGGRLDEAEKALQTAVERNPASAAAWSELGVVLRMRGNFSDAVRAYEGAIAADPGYAPAYRNLGVLLDLYVGDPQRALAAFEHYKTLTSEEKPIGSWIAELRQRTGQPGVTQPPEASTAQTPAPVSEGGIE
jgi:Flp pilus assembly protein TadD